MEGDDFMNKLSKILICIILILVIALAIMTYQYFKMKDTAKENFDNYTNTLNDYYELYRANPTTE